MPALLGAGAEFIPNGDYMYDDDIIDIRLVPNSKTLIGYIYGGIESTDLNIFFVNDGTQSSASNTIFKVYINKSTVGLNEYTINGNSIKSSNIYPNPVKKDVNIDYYVPKNALVKITIIDTNGKLIMNASEEQLTEGSYTSTINVSELSKGIYIVRVDNGIYISNYQFVKK